MSFKKITVDRSVYMRKYVYNVSSIKYLKAYMPNTSQQVSNGIEAFNDNRKTELETVHY